MGKRDIRHRESKKVKKGIKKATEVNILTPPMTVAVIKKGKKAKEEEEE